jgi:hypothetical protein
MVKGNRASKAQKFPNNFFLKMKNFIYLLPLGQNDDTPAHTKMNPNVQRGIGA